MHPWSWAASGFVNMVDIASARASRVSRGNQQTVLALPHYLRNPPVEGPDQGFGVHGCLNQRQAETLVGRVGGDVLGREDEDLQRSYSSFSSGPTRVPLNSTPSWRSSCSRQLDQISHLRTIPHDGEPGIGETRSHDRECLQEVVHPFSRDQPPTKGPWEEKERPAALVSKAPLPPRARRAPWA